MVSLARFFTLISIAFWGLLLFPAGLFGQSDKGPVFLDRNLTGGRIGVWTNMGEEDVSPDADYSLEFSEGSIYAEFFYGWRINRALCLEIQLGLYSRGEVEYFRNSSKFIGSVNIYPIFLATKLYPLYAFEKIPVHLYIQPGFGIVIGSQSVVDYDVYYDYALVEQQTRAKLTYMLSTGLDWPVADQISLLFNYKYVPVKFGKPLAQLKDYSGWSVTFGVGYIFGS